MAYDNLNIGDKIRVLFDGVQPQNDGTYKDLTKQAFANNKFLTTDGIIYDAKRTGSDAFGLLYEIVVGGSNVRTSAAIIAYMNLLEQETTLALDTALEDRTFTVADATGISVGKYLILFDVNSNRFSPMNVTAVNGTLITVDTPLDFAYPSGAFVSVTETNMAVDGSVTPVTFGLRNTESTIGQTYHMTRLMFTCLTDTAIDLAKFGDIANGLANGIVIRTKNGIYQNLFNAKTNGDLANLMYDFTVLEASNPNQGQDGFLGRFTVQKLGTLIDLPPGDDLQVIIQDDLSSLIKLNIIAEGYEV